jgi:hypothetical protein
LIIDEQDRVAARLWLVKEMLVSCSSTSTTDLEYGSAEERLNSNSVLI